MSAKDVFEAIGLGPPFYFAAAAFGFFHWLDRSASPQARRAISSWLRGQPFRDVDVRLAITGAFDRIYTAPLLSVKAFTRSAALSSLIWIAYVAYNHRLYFPQLRFASLEDFVLIFAFVTIISDYISLFVLGLYSRC
jgi:hypothetical protein